MISEKIIIAEPKEDEKEIAIYLPAHFSEVGA